MPTTARVKLIKWLIDLNERLFFERRLRRFYRNSPVKLDLVIDVGANKGQSIDFFLKLNPQVEIYAMEPNPDLFALLQSKYKDLKNIHIFNLAVSNETGSRIFFENVFDYTSSFEELDETSDYLRKKAGILGVKVNDIIKNQYPVSTITLSEFITTHVHKQEIDLIKIDTEGHEYYCLEGLFRIPVKPSVLHIQLEHHHDDMYKNKVPYDHIVTLLTDNGFETAGRVKHAFGAFDEMIYRRKG